MSVALFSSVLAYIFWNRGVELVGANVAGLFVHLMPVFGVVLAWLFLDERLAPFHLAGIALILAGIVVTSRYAPPRGADAGARRHRLTADLSARPTGPATWPTSSPSIPPATARAASN